MVTIIQTPISMSRNGIDPFITSETGAFSIPDTINRFIPTGGVDLGNLKEFIDFDKVYAVGGSFMMKGSPLDITRICKEAMKICES